MHLARIIAVRLHVASPQHADYGDIFQQNAIGRDRGNPPAREPDHQQAAFRRDALARQIENIAADRIVNGIGAAARDLLYSLHPGRIRIIEHVIRALLGREFALGLAPRSGDHARAERLADLNRRHSHSARPGMHQQPFAGSQHGAMRQGKVGGVVNDRHSRGFLETHFFRDRKNMGERRNRAFRESAALGHRRNTIARAKLRNALAQGVHHARNFRSGGERKRRLHLIFSLDLQNIEKIQRGGVIANANLAPPRLGWRDFLERHRFRFSPAMHSPTLHFARILVMSRDLIPLVCHEKSEKMTSAKVVHRLHPRVINTIPKTDRVQDSKVLTISLFFAILFVKKRRICLDYASVPQGGRILNGRAWFIPPLARIRWKHWPDSSMWLRSTALFISLLSPKSSNYG